MNVTELILMFKSWYCFHKNHCSIHYVALLYAVNKIITVKLYISPSPNWVRWQIVRAMFGSCMRFSALCNNCDAASWMMFYSFEILSSFTLLIEVFSSSKLIILWFIKADWTCELILSLLHCLCICMLFICMVQCRCFALITCCWSATQMHTSFFLGHTMFVSSHPLVLYSALWRPCLLSSHPPLLFLSTSLSLSLSLSLATASSLEKASPLPEGRSRSLRSNRSYLGVLSQSSKWPRSLSFLEQRSSNTLASSTCSSLERPPHSER